MAREMAQGLRPFQVYLHASYKSPAEGVELLYKGIKEEMRHPTNVSDGDIHRVAHQDILKDLAWTMGKRAKEGKEGELKLRQLLVSETRREVKDLLVIALGYSGDKTVWRNLVGIMKQKGQPVIRECAAKALAFELNARLAIPDLIDALRDPEFVIRGVPQIETDFSMKEPVFPVRYMASHILGLWGVHVDAYPRTTLFEFEVDKVSAVKALKPELQHKDKEHVKQAIEAIARVGGPTAKAELKRFIEEQQRFPAAMEVAEKAKAALSHAEAAEKMALRVVKDAAPCKPARSSLVEALAATLACKNQEEAVSAALDAIAQCDGKLSKPELERFIAENSGKPERSALVTKAKQVLSRIKL
jgi:hypothetical protein